MGRIALYNGEPYTIVGVLAADFDFYGTANANNGFFIPIGRMADQSYMHDRRSHPADWRGAVDQLGDAPLEPLVSRDQHPGKHPFRPIVAPHGSAVDQVERQHRRAPQSY